jgi:hypothetical protein
LLDGDRYGPTFLRDAFLQVGQYDSGSGPMFTMTALAMRSADATLENGNDETAHSVQTHG